MYRFKELSIHKSGEKKSFISFQPGLNLILGPSDTGKTLIFQCLDFLLGASELPKSPLPSYDSVDAVLSTKDGSLSISRSPKAARSELCVANQGEKYPYKQIGAFWFQLLGLSNPNIKVIGKSNGKREKLSWRKIVKLFVVRDQRLLSDSILTSEIFATPVNIRALFLYLLTQNNFECQRSSQEANLQNAERSGRLKRTKDLIEKLREELQNLPDYPESLEELQAQVADELAKLNRELVERRQEIRNFNRQLYANEREIAQKSLSLRNYDALDEQYEADLRRLNLIFEGEFHSSRDQAKGRCPLCESEIEGFGADAQPDAAIAEYRKISQLREDLRRARTSTEEEIAEAEATAQELDLPKNRLEADVFDAQNAVAATKWIVVNLVPDGDCVEFEGRPIERFGERRFDKDFLRGGGRGLFVFEVNGEMLRRGGFSVDPVQRRNHQERLVRSSKYDDINRFFSTRDVVILAKTLYRRSSGKILSL